MDEQMIQAKFQKAQTDSIQYRICYILSNGKDLQTVVTEQLKEDLKEKGYWVAAIFENGIHIDL